MAGSNKAIDKINTGNGYVRERGTFNLASVTTWTITADTTSAFSAGNESIAQIEEWGFSSDNDHAVIPNTTGAGIAPNQIKITGTSNDTGSYWIKGKAR